MNLLDTSAVLELFYGSEKGEIIKGLIKGRQVVTTSFTIYELTLSQKEHEKEQISSLTEEIPIITFDKESAVESAKIENELKRSGKMINKVDIFIAGICKERDFSIITTDKDFLNVKDLKSKLI